MNRKQLSILLLSTILFAGSSCKPKHEDAELSAGEVNAARFVAIGGSAVAGFMDDALYSEGQNYSLGNIIAGQLKLIGGGDFIQPWIPSSLNGCNADGLSRFILGYKTDCLGVTSLSPIRMSTSGDVAQFDQYVFDPANGNFGIPGLTTQELNLVGYGDPLQGTGNYNPYFKRFASSWANATVSGDVAAVDPTFFTLFLGVDDVLGFVKKGAASGTMTPVTDFATTYSAFLDQLTGNGAKGVLGTVPDVSDLPYFTTIPYDGLVLDEQKATDLNNIYNPIGIYFQVGKNPFMIEDPSAGAFGVRQMVPGELIALSVPLDSVKCYKMGSVFPFRNEFVLTLDELDLIRTTIDGYNNHIISEAGSRGLALADSDGFYEDLKSGVVYNGISMTTKFVSGGAFSLDGINLNPRGMALLANEFIRAINAKYGSTMPLVDVTKYPGVKFP